MNLNWINLTIALCLLTLTVSAATDKRADVHAQQVEQAREANAAARSLADRMPHPMSTPSAKPEPTHSIREQILTRFTTIPGLVVASITLALTLLLCRPRGQKRTSDATFSLTAPNTTTAPSNEKTLVEKFRDSMAMNYERWHDGIGYDVHLIDQATPAERSQIESLVFAEPVTEWFVVEALARLRTPRCMNKLNDTLACHTSHEVKLAISEYAADLITPQQRSAILIAALREAPITKGIPQALRQIVEYHPTEIIEALLQATLQREGDVAMHCAALLLLLHGAASSTFDRAHLSFLQRFASTAPDERVAAHQDLQTRLGR
jgi:hypothetical protein